MGRQERKGKEKAASRKDYFAITGILAYIGSLIFRIPLLHMIGEKGVGYFSIANELFIVIGCIFAYGLSEATANLVRYRIKREQFKNADKVLHRAAVLALILGGGLSIIFLFAGHSYAKNVIQMPLAGLAVSLMAPAIVFYVLTGVLKGYFQGNGSRVPAIHSKVLETVFMIGGGLIGAGLMHKYGEKVSALLQNEDYAAAYGAMGAVIGLLSASVLCFLHMLLLFFLYHGRVKRQGAREIQKNQDKGFHIVHMLLGTGLSYALFAAVFQLLPFLDGCLFIRLSPNTADTAALWGSFYGKYMVIIGICSALLSLVAVEPSKRIIFLLDREEYKAAKDKLAVIMHQIALLAVPTAIFTAVLAENLLNLLFKGNNSKPAVWVMWGSITIVFYVFSSLFSGMMIRLRKMNYVIGYGLLALLAHVITVILLLGNTDMGIVAVVIGNIIFYVVSAALGFFLICRNLQYVQEVRSIAFTLIAAGIAGLIVMLLNRVFSSMLGSTISLVICLPIGIAAYLVLLIVSKGICERELENMPGGIWLIRLAKVLRLM